jgi:tetratricopeptide (TPR) repeat protein
VKTQRNDSCHCNSGKKYKKCCLLIDEVCFIPANFDPYERRFSAEINELVEDECHDILEQLEKDNNIAGAKEAVRILLDQHPQNYFVHFTQGICFIKEEKVVQAIASFEKTVEIYPVCIEAFYNLGNLYRKEVNIPAFIFCHRRILKIASQDSEIYQTAQQELDELEKLLKETDGTSLDGYIQCRKLFDHAFTCLTQGQHDLAILFFKKVLSLNPTHVQSFGNIALAYAGLGKRMQALRYLDKALALDPTYEPAHMNRIRVMLLEEGEKLEMGMDIVDYYRDRARNRQ